MFFEDNIDHAKYSGHLYGLGTSFIVNGTNFHESNGESNNASWFILMKNAVVHDKKFEQVAGAASVASVPAPTWTGNSKQQQHKVYTLLFNRNTQFMEKTKWNRNRNFLRILWEFLNPIGVLQQN